MATRKSTRVTKKAATLTQKEPLSNDTEKTTQNVQSSRNLKKQKISNEETSNNAIAARPNRSKTRGKRGNINFSIDIPFDILLEIFKLLEPIDLLHLSRVSKS